jgi:hypothetical protein
VRDRKRLQKDRFHDAEQGGVGADAERQRQHDDGGESRRRPQCAERVLQIAPSVVEPRPQVILFFALRRVVRAFVV